ncbi:glycosyltransferase family 4 protein [Candidatus Poribacteria bacterium]
MNILYPIIDGEVTGGNIICLRFIEEAKKRGWNIFVNSPTRGDFIDMIRDRCARVYHIDTTRSFRLDRSVELVKMIKREKVDLVHCHTPLPDTNLSRIAAALAGVPIVTHAHLRQALNSNPLVRTYQLMLDWCTSRLFCDRIIAVSEAVRTDFTRQGSPQNKIDVVHNGIDTKNNRQEKNSDAIRKEFNLTAGQKLVGEVARLCETKGQHVLIRAACSVIREFPDAVFMIVGEDIEKDGKYKEELEELAKELGVEENFIFTGYRSDVPDLMNAFDVFILPSFAEGLPVTILEAMAAQKPVITTPAGGNTEIVIHNETGLIFPFGDSDQLAIAILHLLKNPQEARLMGQKGYERVQAHFSLDQMVGKTFQIYDEIMQKQNLNGLIAR